MKTAFKEWAIIIDALGRGDQILILRKGGIAEGAGGFHIERPRFLFFPTLFHQQRESVMPAAQARFDEIAPHLAPPETVRLEFCAEVVAWRKLDSFAAVERLRGQHIWREEVLAHRFDWGRQQSIFALAVRVARLPKRIELPMLSSYGGCKSWVELATEISTENTQPVLAEAAFQTRLRQFETALAG